MLVAGQLSKRYGDITALDRLSLTVRSGELYCLLGANGAGKTTTVSLFLGFITPTTGSATVNGIDVAAEPVRAKAHVAYVPEQVSLYDSFTAREILQFFTRLNGLRLSRQELDAAMCDAGLDEAAFNRPIQTFSKGMRQKLLLAIAISKRADALLLDEPTNGLDPLASSEFSAVLRRLRDSGKAILMSTHDLFRGKELADRVGFLRRGRLVAEYSRAELSELDLEQLYIGHMSAETGDR